MFLFFPKILWTSSFFKYFILHKYVYVHMSTQYFQWVGMAQNDDICLFFLHLPLLSNARSLQGGDIKKRRHLRNRNISLFWTVYVRMLSLRVTFLEKPARRRALLGGHGRHLRSLRSSCLPPLRHTHCSYCCRMAYFQAAHTLFILLSGGQIQQMQSNFCLNVHVEKKGKN